MIAEAIDAAITLGWALAAWIVVLAAAAAVVLLAGTVVGVWAVRGAWRVLYGRLSASERRLRLRAARVARRTPAATGPSRPHSPRWSALHRAGGGFPTRIRQRASTGRTAPRPRPVPSWAHTQPHTHEEAA